MRVGKDKRKSGNAKCVNVRRCERQIGVSGRGMKRKKGRKVAGDGTKVVLASLWRPPTPHSYSRRPLRRRKSA